MNTIASEKLYTKYRVSKDRITIQGQLESTTITKRFTKGESCIQFFNENPQISTEQLKIVAIFCDRACVNSDSAPVGFRFCKYIQSYGGPLEFDYQSKVFYGIGQSWIDVVYHNIGITEPVLVFLATGDKFIYDLLAPYVPKRDENDTDAMYNTKLEKFIYAGIKHNNTGQVMAASGSDSRGELICPIGYLLQKINTPNSLYCTFTDTLEQPYGGGSGYLIVKEWCQRFITRVLSALKDPRMDVQFSQLAVEVSPNVEQLDIQFTFFYTV